jgi:hypothetical protein
MKKQVMKNSIIKLVIMSLAIMVFSSVLFFSCKSGASKIRLIPSSDLVNVLTELYVADGLLAYPPIRAQFSAKDSISNYTDIISKHGFTKERMDYTIRYYFEKKPKKFENIYDQVLTRLSERQSLLEKETPPVTIVSRNLWKAADFIAVPEAGINDNAWFTIPVSDTGNYILEFNTTVYSDDQSINPRVKVFFWHTDSSKAEYRIDWPEAVLYKDGQIHKYSVAKRFSDTTFTHISGWLLFSDPKEGRWVKHARVENIILMKKAVTTE